MAVTQKKYVIPIIDGIENKFNTSFSFQWGVAKINFILGDGEAVDFLNKATTAEPHTLHYKADVSGKAKLLLNKCNVYITEIFSEFDGFAEIELTVEKIDDFKN